MLGVVGSNLTIFKFEPTTPNMSQQGGQTHATCCAQQGCNMLSCYVAIVWLGLNKKFFHLSHYKLTSRPLFSFVYFKMSQDDFEIPCLGFHLTIKAKK